MENKKITHVDPISYTRALYFHRCKNLLTHKTYFFVPTFPHPSPLLSLVFLFLSLLQTTFHFAQNKPYLLLHSPSESSLSLSLPRKVKKYCLQKKHTLHTLFIKNSLKFHLFYQFALMVGI